MLGVVRNYIGKSPNQPNRTQNGDVRCRCHVIKFKENKPPFHQIFLNQTCLRSPFADRLFFPKPITLVIFFYLHGISNTGVSTLVIVNNFSRCPSLRYLLHSIRKDTIFLHESFTSKAFISSI